MAKIGYVQNGVSRAKKNGTKKNGVRSATSTPKRNGITKTRASAWAKRNGLKLVTKSAANPKRRKKSKRRNGLASVSSPRRNGLLGNTKSDAKKVVYIGGGLFLTKALSRVVQSFANPYLSQVGVGQYGEIISDGVVALTVMPFLGGKLISKEAGDLARLGGLLAVGVDVIEMIAPDTFGQFNPFNNSPIVMAGNQPLVTPQAVAQIVAETDASPSAKAQVAGAMQALQSGATIDFGNQSTQNSVPIFPLYD